MVQIGTDLSGQRPADEALAQSSELPAGAAGGSAAIGARLRQAIMSGAYAYGERLPAERELASHFGASRSTVREALRRLEELHLVARRIGSGTFVSYRSSLAEGNVAELTSPLELIEVRVGIEPQIVRLAVVNASARDLDRLAEALERVEAVGADREAFSRADERFHLALAECTRNPLMVWLYRQINDVRCHAQWEEMKNKILSASRIADYNRYHRRLYEALRSRDMETALAAINGHMDQARRDLLGASPG